MLKEIRYTGYTAVPSDYDCTDGQLAQCLNLINEDGSLRPLFPPKRVLTLPASQRVVYMHRTSAFAHYIIHDTESLSLLWLDPDSGEAVDLGDFPSVMQVAGVGNTLIVLTPAGMHYFLWKPDLEAYADLGSRIPFPEISFALALAPVAAGEDSFTVELDIPDGLTTEVSARWLPQAAGSGAWRPHPSASLYKSPEYKALINDASTAVLAGLNKYVAEAADECRFTEPFFVRYALRLFDGSHVMHSAPVLMIPNSAGPVLAYTPTLDGSSFSAPTSIIHSRCSLLFRFLKADLDAWADIVTHVDFFVSAPVYTFDQSGQVNPGKASVTAAEGKFSHAGEGGAHVNTSRADPVAGADVLFNSGNYERPLTIPSGMEWNIGHRNASEIAEAVTSQQASLYYLVSSIEVGKVAAMEAFNFLDMQDKSLRNIVTRPRLADDYQSHHTLIPSLAHMYNSRLNLAGILLRPFEGFSLPAMTQFYKPAGTAAESSVRVLVRLRRDGGSVWVGPADEHSLPAQLGEGYFPRWLFYPDSSAVEMVIADESGYWRIPLTTHDFLEGAYWFRGLESMLPDHISFAEAQDPDKNLPWSFPPEDTPGGPRVEMPSKLYTSEVNNPFFFPVTGINTVGTGRIIGMASAAKALSQGQFGQFPLYAFTDEGVWALEVSASGGFAAKQPITRDVCLSAESITQIDSAVLFATDRGIMLISGSQTQCITDVLDSPDRFDSAGLPGLEGRFPDCAFADYVRDCRMAYDYLNQRIILFNPGKPYAYVYSMKTKLWGMWESSLVSTVNSYPDALAMAGGGEDGNYLVDLSRTDAVEAHCMLVTRPLKFDGPDVLKTVTTAVQRGIFPLRAVDTIIYGTRDYINWHLVGSSRSPQLRCLRGTPWKAFRLVSVATLAKGHSLAGCSFEVIPRFTRRLR